MEKKKYLRYSILIILIVLLGIYVYIRYPRTINKTYTGLKYKLGVENINDLEEVTIKINGKVTSDFWLNKKFKGKFYISNIDELITNKDNISKLKDAPVTIIYNRLWGSLLSYPIFNSGKDWSIDSEIIGNIYHDTDFKELTILCPQPTWRIKDG
ncbi:hypothetical protein HZI73_19690 [Vallitalea pronyensis]|uniref:Uncharacterized protein n=1 Tax=Vallitalea pronyensis TaxID=1348613 RepID=A0A8J8MMV4_9FIRM|nr:hypothetical protein [Vallitalea pronyensis]QUI24381.1 hypothetical protein HZI73_19690 [Vallitalea pronyensis]